MGGGGCVASQEGEAITKRAPFVDLVFGPQTLHRLPEMIAQLRRTGRSVVDGTLRSVPTRTPRPRLGCRGRHAAAVGRERWRYWKQNTMMATTPVAPSAR